MQPIAFDNRYVRELGDLGVPWKPTPSPSPRMLFFNAPLARALGLDDVALNGDEGLAVFSGRMVPAGAEPFAQVYAGHQFGGFSPQLGDGRALLLGEVLDPLGQRRDLAFKGSGRTPFSRGGDGKAAVGPMLREALMGEAMHALGIPTTRALAVVATGEAVRRERMLPGAILTRVASSHLRVGTLQYLAARQDLPRLRRLADHAIARHVPDVAPDDPQRYEALLRTVVERQARLVAQWMNVGFIHGVMNTDNMTLSGETMDYGPCAFMEAYDPAAVFSSIDHHGRYAYGNQPAIARWNLARLAETLLPLMAGGDGPEAEHEEASDEAPDEAALAQAAERATQIVLSFGALHDDSLLQGQRAKLGLSTEIHPGRAASAQQEDGQLVQDWLALLQQNAVDFTRAWRGLADAAEGRDDVLRAQMTEVAALDAWLVRWRARCRQDSAASGASADTDAAATPGAARAMRMRAVSPWIIPRNHRVEEALAAAQDHDDTAPFDRLMRVLQRPFDQQPDAADLEAPAPANVTATYHTFCGT